MHNLIPLTSLCGVIPYLSVYPKLPNSLDIRLQKTKFIPNFARDFQKINSIEPFYNTQIL